MWLHKLVPHPIYPPRCLAEISYATVSDKGAWLMADVFNHPLVSPDLWKLDQDLTFLNHGSFGACPIEVLERQRAYQDQLERSPVAFYLRTLPTLIYESRVKLAELIHAPEESIAFVSNASEGVSIALNSLHWEIGDEVVINGRYVRNRIFIGTHRDLSECLRHSR